MVHVCSKGLKKKKPSCDQTQNKCVMYHEKVVISHHQSCSLINIRKPDNDGKSSHCELKVKSYETKTVIFEEGMNLSSS